MFNFLRKISDDTRSLPMGVKLIVFTIFLRSFGWGFVDPFYSIFVGNFSGSYAGVGGLVSILELTSMITIIPLMRLADKMRDTAIMRDGEVLYIFAVGFYMLAALTGKIGFLIVAFILNGVAYPLVIVGAETYLRKYGNLGGETKTFSFYTALNYLGWILGMVMGAFTVQYYGFRWMFLFVLPGCIAGLLVLKHVHEDGLRSIIWGVRQYFHNGHDFKALLDDIRTLDRKALFPLFLSFFDGVIVMFSYVFVPLFALTLNLSLGAISLLMAIMYLPFIFSFLFSELTDKLKRTHVIALGLFIGGFAFILLSFIVHQVWVALLVALESASLAILRPAYNGILTRLTPRRMMGEITGLNNMAMKLGYIVGPVASGFIADRFSIQTAFFTIAIFAFILAAVTLSSKGYETLPTDL
jgi:MFS transporter, ACDE family, multidrug resistance protein